MLQRLLLSRKNAEKVSDSQESTLPTPAQQSVMVIQEDVNMDVGEGQATHVVDSSDSDEPEEEDRVILPASKAGNPSLIPPHVLFALSQ